MLEYLGFLHKALVPEGFPYYADPVRMNLRQASPLQGRHWRIKGTRVFMDGMEHELELPIVSAHATLYHLLLQLADGEYKRIYYYNSGIYAEPRWGPEIILAKSSSTIADTTLTTTHLHFNGTTRPGIIAMHAYKFSIWFVSRTGWLEQWKLGEQLVNRRVGRAIRFFEENEHLYLELETGQVLILT